jgi:hypothetical protein
VIGGKDSQGINSLDRKLEGLRDQGNESKCKLDMES